MTTEIEKAEKTEVVMGNSPAEMIRMAVSGGADLEKLSKLLDIQERWEANEAKKAYVAAMSAFKANAPKVSKDKENKQYKSMYTTLGNLVNTVNPELSKHGLSASWDIFQNGIIKVSCKMTHKLGHSETAEASAPADTSGAKNPIQQIKSTITYLKSVTLESICGLASSDSNYDDDANSAYAEYISDEEAITVSEYLTALKIDKVKFMKYMGAKTVETILKKDLPKALQAFKSKEAKK